MLNMSTLGKFGNYYRLKHRANGIYRRGSREDYQKLKDLGVELEGKIALAQYGGANRGVKIKNAEVSLDNKR